MLVRALSMLLLFAALGGCSISGLLPDSSADPAGPEPAYRFIIANRIKEIVGEPSRAGVLEISGVRRVESFKGASWVACIKAQHILLPPRYYAVFIQREQMVDSRLSVVIDQCELQAFTYTPFNWILESNTPPPLR
jgi:hypothetical protein